MIRIFLTTEENNMRRMLIALVCTLQFLLGPSQLGLARSGMRDEPREFVPKSTRPAERLALVLSLHGYAVNGAWIEDYFKLNDAVESHRFVLIIPEGMKNDLGLRYWNATDACCAPEESDTDDVGYLSGLIESAMERYPIDPEKVYVVGHSNGGYMGMRLACDRADLVRKVVSFAGHVFKDTSLCQPSRPVSILTIHGEDDSAFEPSEKRPGALETIQFWANHNNCDASEQIDRYNHNLLAWGSETQVHAWANCDSPVRFWRMENSGHVPFLTGSFTRHMLEFLFDLR
jgi:polyhydroxybutyrate depolymerase